MIPDEAVEAATDALQQFALTEDRDGLQAWDAYARAAVEAAAPHMRQVADECNEEMEDRIKSVVLSAANTIDYTPRLYAAVQEIMDIAGLRFAK